MKMRVASITEASQFSGRRASGGLRDGELSAQPLKHIRMDVREAGTTSGTQ